MQPILRKLKIEYGEYVEILYHMGGLLPSWDNYNRGVIKVPLDAAQHWNETSEIYNVPIDGDIWIENNQTKGISVNFSLPNSEVSL
jgi:hypothetical protein